MAFPHTRWKEGFVSTEFLLVWIMLYTELSRNTARVALRTHVPHSPCLYGSIQLSASPAAPAAGAEPVEPGEGLPSAASEHTNTSAEFQLPGDSPEP